MRIKIGDEWHAIAPGKPIMAELSDDDKRNIVNMLPECTKYAVFDDADETTSDEKLAWMKA